MKVFIDAGHNYTGHDTGAQGNGLKEQEVSFTIADYLRLLLLEAGHNVKMSRNSMTDSVGNTVSSSIGGRAAQANEWGADVFLSIHCNAGGGRGTECLIYGRGGTSEEYATGIQRTIVDRLGTMNRGVKVRAELGVWRLTSMPAVLIETAFIDNEADARLLRDQPENFALAIFEGLLEKMDQKSIENNTNQTVMRLPSEVYVQEIEPENFDILVCDAKKRSVAKNRYFNGGYFAVQADGSTIPVGNLASEGVIVAQAKDNPAWINLSQKALTTIYTVKDYEKDRFFCYISKTDRLENIPGLRSAISGIPIIFNGKFVPYEAILAEGYFGNELYDTWHGFLGIRNQKLCYVAMKCGFEEMCWALVALGIYDAIKLDGGGSFILHDIKELSGTYENRRIHNVGVWTS
ncbi:MAG: N-acetylmuramoyl-L-alanine amidase [Ruminococcaceae bacterium]|nr:N-acetylmuramoyl-L-alanine amidase [Oscillospiraceae bacterium]